MTSEAEFKRAWLALPRQDDLFHVAFDGGTIADRLSFVFVAAYQCAIRECFDGLAPDHWYAYAASEDRTGTLPGVSYQDGRLNGTKTWIASSDYVDAIIVVVAGSYLVVSPQSPGVEIETGPRRDFLGDMSQGRATFRDTVPTTELSIAASFGLAEAFYATTSAAGFLAKRFRSAGADDLLSATMTCAQRLDDLRLSQPGELLTVHQELKALGKRCAAERDTEGEIARDWQQNGSLLAMYGRAFAA